jgi:hypothetical protein
MTLKGAIPKTYIHRVDKLIPILPMATVGFDVIHFSKRTLYFNSLT